MGRGNERLRRQGYSAGERRCIDGITFVGALAPIVAARYILSPAASTDWKEELFWWGSAVLANVIPVVVSPHVPVPLYTALAGRGLGIGIVERSRSKCSGLDLNDGKEFDLPIPAYCTGSRIGFGTMTRAS